MGTSLKDILKRQLMFPLPRSDELRGSEAPIIPLSNPLFDYYEDSNWGKGPLTAGSYNKVIILPSSIPDDLGRAGIFQAIPEASIQEALTATTWENLVNTDDYEEVGVKLEKFVKGFVQNLVRASTSASTHTVTESASDVFPLAETDEPLTRDNATTMQRATVAYAEIAKTHSATELRDTIFNLMRPYYAFKFIDSIFPDPSEYFFIQRIILCTKLMFVNSLVRKNGAESYAISDNILGYMYNDSVQYSTVDPSTDTLEQKYDANGLLLPRGREGKFALDDMFRENVELSHEVKETSQILQEKKMRLMRAKDNLSSMTNSDELVKKQRRNSNIMFYVGTAMLVLQIVSLLTAEYLKSPMLGFVVIIVYALIVLLVESTKSISALMNL